MSQWFLEKPIAHRGFHWLGDVDENSWEAIELARDKGLPIEFDVHLSCDGVPYIHHDLSLLRMTGRDLNGTHMTAVELQDMTTPNSSRGIPLLGDVLEMVSGKVPLVIEIKRTRKDLKLEEAVSTLLDHYKGEFSLQSFHPGSINYLRGLNKGWTLGYLSGSLEDEELNFFTRTLLKSLSLAPFLKPDYIGYEVGELFQRAPQHIREHYHIPLIGWTVRTENQRLICNRFADNMIFENLNIS